MVAGRDYIWLVVGDRCWGIGTTEKEAIGKCNLMAGRTVRTHLTYLADKSVSVDEFGNISWFRGKGRKNLLLIRRIAEGVEQTPPVSAIGNGVWK